MGYLAHDAMISFLGAKQQLFLTEEYALEHEKVVSGQKKMRLLIFRSEIKFFSRMG